MLEQHWKELMQTWGFADNAAMFVRLCAAYGESQRHYHTLEHLEDCLQKAKLLRQSASKPAQIEMALWFHDAIYKPYSSSNELESAQWAERFLQDNDADSDDIARVYAMIMATKHASTDQYFDSDTALLLDIDLSILGEDAATYNRYEKNIRREYRWVPFFLYRKKRREILNYFLQRENIYTHAFFYTDYTERAKKNLRATMATL
jgi:predicted metal-dependent HD superfamily phosphohydrolase